MKRILSLSLASLLILMLLSGCSGLQVKDQPQIRADVDTFLCAVLAGDTDAAYAAVYSGIDRTEFDLSFVQIQEILGDVETYQLTPIQYNYSNRNGIATTQLGYRMETDAGTFLISAAAIEGYEGLASFYAVPQEQTTLSYTGTPGHMDGANGLQWVVLILGLLSWGFIIWAFVDCCRRKIRLKPLWLLLIAFGALILTLTLSGGSVNFRFNVGIYLTISSLVHYGDGSAQLCLAVPLGAIVYLAMRKRLEKAAVSEPADVSAEPLPAEMPCGESINEIKE